MEELEIVKNWVLAFPLWKGRPLAVDATPVQPESGGLFPLGMETLWRRENVVGTVRCRYRRRFLLRCQAGRGEAAAGWLMDFAAWVSKTPAPELGENPQVYTQGGKLAQAAPGKPATYEIKIIIEYEKENGYGKD